MIDPYCYENSDVLKNKLGIKDGAELDRAEVDFSCNAIHELSISPLDGKYDFEHFCNFHAYIFKDIYEWAGEPRTVEMEKAEAVLGYMSIEYTKPKEINDTASAVLKKMNEKNWGEMSLEEQAKNLSSGMADLWKVHSFREGNTRTTITFVCQFADSKGMFMDRELFEKHSAYTRNALVAASAIFKDGDFRKTEFLYNIVKDSLENGQKNRQQEKLMGIGDWKSQIAQMRADDNPKKKAISPKMKNDRNER
ncbi:MAG: Fic/DOC family protein [Lachnospirales bacterium]